MSYCDFYMHNFGTVCHLGFIGSQLSRLYSQWKPQACQYFKFQQNRPIRVIGD